MRIAKVFRSNRGETLTELLVSLLVISFALAALSTMVAIASNLAAKTEELDEKYYEELSNAQDGGDDEAIAVITRDDSAGMIVEIHVKYDADSSMSAYVRE